MNVPVRAQQRLVALDDAAHRGAPDRRHHRVAGAADDPKLAALVAQSLVRVDESGPDEPRFRMLQTVRAYAAERLAERGETDATVSRLARYLIGVVQAVGGDLGGPAHRSVAERLDRESGTGPVHRRQLYVPV